MKKIFLFIAALCTLSAMATEGALCGCFSINAQGDKIQFSKGNLQYQASTHTWRFAAHQYDIIGKANSKISASYSGWIDLFGWGTGNEPTKTFGDFSIYCEWGKNPIIYSTGSNQWRTLTADEWVYLFHDRANAEDLFGLGTVNGIHGMIILPDSWTTPSGLVFYASTMRGFSWQDYHYSDYYRVSHYADNTYTSKEWQNMEASGAVFLPAAGYRWSTYVYEVGSLGAYWSASTLGGDACDFHFESILLYPRDYLSRENGLSVRLVRDVE